MLNAERSEIPMPKAGVGLAEDKIGQDERDAGTEDQNYRSGLLRLEKVFECIRECYAYRFCHELPILVLYSQIDRITSLSPMILTWFTFKLRKIYQPEAVTHINTVHIHLAEFVIGRVENLFPLAPEAAQRYRRYFPVPERGRV